MRLNRSLLVPIVFVAALAVYPSLAEQAYVTYTLLLVLCYTVIAEYMNLLLGYTGITFIGPMVPFAVGGYTAGYLALNGVQPLIGMLVGGILAAGSSFAFSLVSMRLRGLYMALYSFVFTLAFAQLISRQDIPALFHVFFAGIGQSGIPDVVAGGFSWRNADGLAYYYLAIVLFVVSTLVLRRVLASRYGTAFRSIRDSEVFASTLGVGILRMKIVAFLISFFFIGLVGGVLTIFYGAIGLSILDISNIFLFLVFVVFGGLGTFWGPLVGTIVLEPIFSYVTTFGGSDLLASAVPVLVVVLLFPRGVVGTIERFIQKRRAPRG